MTAFHVKDGVTVATGASGETRVAVPGTESVASKPRVAVHAPPPDARHARTFHWAGPMASMRLGITEQGAERQTCEGGYQNSRTTPSASVTESWYQIALLTGLQE